MRAAKSRKTQTNKSNYMRDEAFGDLKAAMEDARAFERGERRNQKVTRIQAPWCSKATDGHVRYRQTSEPECTKARD